MDRDRIPPDLDPDILDRHCFGDAELAAELLVLFDAQCERLLPVLASGRSVERAEAAHALKGAARAVGAERVGALAHDVEQAALAEAGEHGGGAVASALADAITRVRAVIAQRRQGPT